MQVFFYIPTLAAGGAEKQCSMIASGLKREFNLNIKVVVNSLDAPNQANLELLKNSNVPVILLPSGGIIKKVKNLYALFKSDKNTVLFTFLTFPNFIGAIAARLAGVRRIYSGIRCGWLPFRKLLFEVLTNRVLASKTIFNSHRALEYFTSRGFSRRKSFVISNGIELWDDPPSLGPNETVKIITVGRFTPEKDYPTFLQCVKNVVDQGLNVEAHIVGYGILENQIKNLIMELSLDKFIVIHPGSSDVKSLLFEADIYLSTSTSEGVSNSILEAMNSSLPIVATDVGDNSYMVFDNFNGYLLRAKDIQGLSQALISLIGDGDKRKLFGAESKRILASSFSPATLLKKYNVCIFEEQ